MVVTSTAVIGLAAGVLAVPTGMLLHRVILGAMAGIAGTDIPTAFYAVYRWQLLAPLAFSGVVIAAVGAAVPARWASRQSISAVLRAE